MMKVLLDMRFVFLAVALAIFTQFLTTGTPLLAMVDSFVVMSGLMFISLLAKEIELKIVPTPLPAFAYATIIGIAICIPEGIVRDTVLSAVGKVSFLSCCVPLLAFAGLSVGGKIEELKKLSWKVIALFFLVSTSCFFGAALFAQLGFSLTGVI